MESGYVLNGRYKIIDTLGEGGMANVYVAYDLILKRAVAVKLLRLDMQDDARAVRRFQGEAMSLTELTDPHIVMIYDIGEEQGLQYLVMEYVKGMDLKDYIKQEFPFSLPRILEIMQQILTAVGDAHAHGIIHRDLKPQNILIDQDGNVKITDFGIALAVSHSTMTKTNTVMGSVHYISPEQARGSIVSKQTDIYSLGIILFEMLTGHVPYRGENAVAIIMKHYQEAMPSVRAEHPEIPQALENVVLHATAKYLRDRYASVQEMATDLETALSYRRAEEKPWVPSFKNDDETKILAKETPVAATPQADAVKAANSAKPQSPAPKTAKKKRKWSRKKKVILLLSFLAVLLVGTGIVYAMIPQDTTVPQLQGMTTSEARERLTDAHLKLGKISQEYNDTYYYGQIISSKPKVKTNVKEGLRIDVVVSKGPHKEKFGDYTGRQYQEVKKELIKKGVTVQQEKVFSDKIPQGEIKSQSISAKKKIVLNETSVTFQVSKGTQSFKMRDLSNYTLKSVQDYADEKGLVLNVSHEFSDDFDEGLVMRQAPPEGTVLNQGDTINVVLSDGAQKESSEDDDDDESSSSSSSESSESERFDLTVKVPYQQNDGKKTNKIEIYVGDKNHQIDKVYQSLEISADQTVRLPFELEDGKKGAYKVVRDGQVIMQKDDVTAD